MFFHFLLFVSNKRQIYIAGRRKCVNTSEPFLHDFQGDVPFQHISLVYLEAALKSAETKTGESSTTFPATKGCGTS